MVGISDHGGWAILVTVAADGTLLDRRRVELVDAGMPTIPHHSEAQTLPLQEATALIECVRASAQRHAMRVFAELAADVPGRIGGVALRRCQPLPSTIAERIATVPARNVADWVMYRETLAVAARARGWRVHWFDPKTVFDAAGRSLRIEDFDAYFLQLRNAIGPPANQDHKLALAAALAARGR